MKTGPSLEIEINSLRLKALNVDGVLYQEKVRTLFEQTGFTFHASEFGVDTGTPRAGGIHRESKVDLWFRFRELGCIFDVLIECKKANPDLKEWIFFKSIDASPLYIAELVKREDDSKWTRRRFNASYTGFTAFTGRELKGEWGSSKKTGWKTSSERIEKAADQIAIAMNSVSTRLSTNRDIYKTSGGQPHFIIPVIVTSADLLSCSFTSPFFQSAESETHSDEVNFETLDSVLLRYGVSSHLQADLLVYQEELSKNYLMGTGYLDILVCRTDTGARTVKVLCESIAKQYKPYLR